MTETYQDLVACVREIDADAAKWLEEEAPKRGDFYASGSRLDCVMYWDETPQGYSYWRNISDRIEAKMVGK